MIRISNLLAAALASLNSKMLEAAALNGASRRRILTGIVLPVATPALISSASLASNRSRLDY